jgi:hypothetical protein
LEENNSSKIKELEGEVNTEISKKETGLNSSQVNSDYQQTEVSRTNYQKLLEESKREG